MTAESKIDTIAARPKSATPLLGFAWLRRLAPLRESPSAMTGARTCSRNCSIVGLLMPSPLFWNICPIRRADGVDHLAVFDGGVAPEVRRPPGSSCSTRRNQERSTSAMWRTRPCRESLEVATGRAFRA